VKLPPSTLVHRRRSPRGRTAGGRGGLAPPMAPAPLAARAPATLRVGLWDLGAYVGALPAIVELLNGAQKEMSFFEVIAALPAGIVSQPARVRAWAEERTGSRLRGVEENVMAGDFFRRAGVVRKDLGLDYLAGITSRLVADEDREQVYWNFFSARRGKLLLGSSAGLREYAKRAGRTFEYAVAGVILAQLMEALNPRLVFHEDRGCLFDFNEDREGIVKVLKNPRIDDVCLKRMKPERRATAQAMVEALRQYAGGGRQ
jgi:hypothetical protein